ncbi:MAG: hypothetical protein KAS16_03920 [Thermoplasmata archaeon]|nr:hypothetical protein [Thermoplasmata archaeon]
MKFTYCKDCDDAFKKVTFEGQRCIYCGKENTISLSLSGSNYYIGYFLLVIGAAAFVILDGDPLQLPVIAISLIVGMIISIRSRMVLKNKAIEKGRVQAESEA